MCSFMLRAMAEATPLLGLSRLVSRTRGLYPLIV
jgi:hypothetical protein